MKPLHVLILALVVVAAGSAIWYNNSSEGPAAAAPEQTLFPALADSLSSVSELTLTRAGGEEISIEKKDGEWVLGRKPRYYVDPSKVGTLLVAASEARQVEAKTTNPEFFSRLGLSDISEADSEAVLLSVEASGQSFDVLLGNSSERFGGSTFVRKPTEQATYLVSPAINADTDADAWLDKLIFDIQPDEVQSVTVMDGTNTLSEIRKDAMFGSEFELVGREEGQAVNDAVIRGLARGLSGLRFNDVKQGVAFPVNDYKRLNVTYTLFSGVIVNTTLFYRDNDADAATDEQSGPSPEPKYWLNAGARFDESIAQQFVPQPGSEAADNDEAQRLTLTAADIADRRQEAERISRTRQRWIYEIPAARFESMSRPFESLVISEE